MIICRVILLAPVFMADSTILWPDICQMSVVNMTYYDIIQLLHTYFVLVCNSCRMFSILKHVLFTCGIQHLIDQCFHWLQLAAHISHILMFHIPLQLLLPLVPLTPLPLLLHVERHYWRSFSCTAIQLFSGSSLSLSAHAGCVHKSLCECCEFPVIGVSSL